MLARAAAGCPTTGRLATATDRCCWRPSCSPTASPPARQLDPCRQTQGRQTGRAQNHALPDIWLLAQARDSARLSTPNARPNTYIHDCKYNTGCEIAALVEVLDQAPTTPGPRAMAPARAHSRGVRDAQVITASRAHQGPPAAAQSASTPRHFLGYFMLAGVPAPRTQGAQRLRRRLLTQRCPRNRS